MLTEKNQYRQVRVAASAGRVQTTARHQLQSLRPAPTCFIFANKLAAGEVEAEQCAPLFTNTYGEKREQLLALIQATV